MNTEVEDLVCKLLDTAHQSAKDEKKRKRGPVSAGQEDKKKLTDTSSSSSSSTASVPPCPSKTGGLAFYIPRFSITPELSHDDVVCLFNSIMKSTHFISTPISKSNRSSTLVARAATQIVVATSRYEATPLFHEEESIFVLAAWALEAAEAAFFGQSIRTKWDILNDQVFSTIVSSSAFEEEEDTLFRRQARLVYNQAHREAGVLLPSTELIVPVINFVNDSQITTLILEPGVKNAHVLV